MLMHDCGVGGEHLRMQELIVEHNWLLGGMRWALICQAEARMRREHMERLRRSEVALRTATTAGGGRSAFDPEYRWGTLFRRAVADTLFQHPKPQRALAPSRLIRFSVAVSGHHGSDQQNPGTKKEAQGDGRQGEGEGEEASAEGALRA